MRQHERDLYRRNAEQHIYVIEFTSSTVKVGRTNSPKNRLADHAKTARTHGVTVTRSWFSKPHKGYGENEAALIAFCAERWNVSGGKEYFAAADYAEVLQYASSLPMVALTEADIDEWAEILAATPPMVPRVWEFLEAAKAAMDEKEAESEGSESHVLFEDIAPSFERVEDVTAEGLAKHHAALALVNHHLRMKLDPYADTHAWKAALRKASSGYAISLLLRKLMECDLRGEADAAARALWAESNDGDDSAAQLAEWVTSDGIDCDQLFEMAQVSYEQAQKLKRMRVPVLRPERGES